MTDTIRTYSKLMRWASFSYRLDYLRLAQNPFAQTFGAFRPLNQAFYKSSDWLRARRDVILRDNGRDLGVEGYEIGSRRILVHHMNPVSLDDLDKNLDVLFDPEFLITVSERTHQIIHFVKGNIEVEPVRRFRGDTVLWPQKSNGRPHHEHSSIHKTGTWHHFGDSRF